MNIRDQDFLILVKRLKDAHIYRRLIRSVPFVI